MKNFSLFNLVPEFSAMFTEGITSSNGLSAFVVSFLLLITFIFLAYAVRKFLFALSTTKKYMSLIDGVNPSSLLANRFEIKDRAKTLLHDEGKLWREFDESLVIVSEGSEPILCNSIDAEHFFNTSSLSGSLTENRLLAAVPGFITAFGVIGTFAGLTMGLKGIDLGSQDIDQLKDGIEHMINGASVAFITSLWGVFLSVVFNFSEKALERVVRSKVKAFQNQIDYLYPRITAEQSLANIESLNIKANNTLQGLAEEIGNQMQDQMMMVSQNMRAGLEESLERILAPALEKLASDAHEGSANALESLMDRYMERIGDIGQGQREMLEQVASSVGGASTQMAEGMGHFMKDFRGQLDEVSQSQKHILDTVAKDIDSAADNMTKGFNGVVSDFSQKLDASTQVQKDMLEGVSDSFLNASGEMDKGFKDFMGELSGQMDKVGDVQNALLSQMKASTEHQNTSFTDINNKMAELLSSFSAVVDENNSAAKQFRLSGDKIFSSGQNFEMFANKIDSSVNNMTTTFNELIATAQEVSQQNKETGLNLNQLIQSSDAAINGITECTDKLGRLGEMTVKELAAVQGHFERLQESLKTHVSELEKQMTHVLKEYGDQVQAQTTERMNEWNTQTSSYTGSMRDAISSLAGVVEEIEYKKVAS